MPEPPVRRRRAPRKGDLREAAILDTAWALLAQRPLSLITIQDLASGAGLSRPTFYFYFDSKEAVLRALAERIATEVRETAMVFFEAGTAADIRRGVAAYLARWQEKGAVLRAMDALAETDSELRVFWARLANDLLTEAARALERRQAAGTARPAPPAAEDLVRVLSAMLWRVGRDVSLGQMSRAEVRRIVDTVTAVFIRAMAVEAP